MMKQLLLSLALVAGCCVTAVAGTYNYLTLVSSTVEQSFALKTVKRITFSGSDLVVTTVDGTETHLLLSTLNRLSFTETATAVRGLAAERSQLCIQAGQLVADGQGVLLLFNANGQVVRQQFVSNQRAEMNLNDLPRGLYIAKLGNRTLKILH